VTYCNERFKKYKDNKTKKEVESPGISSASTGVGSPTKVGGKTSAVKKQMVGTSGSRSPTKVPGAKASPGKKVV
jgi:hypothetical protein